jgi:hypothetical protein
MERDHFYPGNAEHRLSRFLGSDEGVRHASPPRRCFNSFAMPSLSRSSPPDRMNLSRRARSFLPVAVLGFHSEAGRRASFSETAERMNSLRLASGMRLRSDSGIFTVTACSVFVIPKMYYRSHDLQACSGPQRDSRPASFFKMGVNVVVNVRGQIGGQAAGHAVKVLERFPKRWSPGFHRLDLKPARKQGPLGPSSGSASRYRGYGVTEAVQMSAGKRDRCALPLAAFLLLRNAVVERPSRSQVPRRLTRFGQG